MGRVRIYPLGPCSKAVNVAGYVSALRSAYCDSSIRNIAVTGRYGAGKSSFLRTFFNRKRWRWFHRSPLWISASRFESLHTDGENRSDQIETAILEQILFVERDGDGIMPFSRFGRIFTPRLSRYIYVFLCWIVLLLGILSVTKPIWFSMWVKYWCTCGDVVLSWLYWTSPIFVILGIGILCQWGYDAYRKGCLRFSLKVGPFSAESNSLSNLPILAQHFEELVYFFASTGRKEVVFEDLDRVKDKSTFEGLRILNQLLNEAIPSRRFIHKRPIRFIYAIKDDIFQSAEERVKFFDFTLPIIPIVGAEMSSNLFVELLKTARCSKEVVDSCMPVIVTLSENVSDRRLIHSICNEFSIMKSVFIKKGEGKSPYLYEKIMSICALKAFYPALFAELTENNNPMDRLISKCLERRDEMAEKVRKSIVDLEIQLKDKVSKTKEEKFRELNEHYMVHGFMPLIPNGCVVVTSNKRPKIFFEIRQFLDPQFVKELVGSEFSFGIPIQSPYNNYTNSRYQFISNCKWDDVEKKIGGISYSERLAAIEDAEKRDDSLLKKEIVDKKHLIHEIETYRMSRLVYDGFVTEDDIKGALGEFGADVGLLRALIANGMVGEDYADYVTLYQPGSLSYSDYRFCVSIRQGREISPSDHLDNPEAVFDSLQDYCFYGKGVLNYDLLSWMLEVNYQSGPMTVEASKCLLRVRKHLASILGDNSTATNGLMSIADLYAFLEDWQGIKHSTIPCALKAIEEFRPSVFNEFCYDKSLSEEQKIDLLITFWKNSKAGHFCFKPTKEHWQLLEGRRDVGHILKSVYITREELIDSVKSFGLSFAGESYEEIPYPEFLEDILALGAIRISLTQLDAVAKACKLTPEFKSSMVLTCIHQWGNKAVDAIVMSKLAVLEDEIADRKISQEDSETVQRKYIFDEKLSIELRGKIAQNERTILIPMRDLPLEIIGKLAEKGEYKPNQDDFCGFVKCSDKSVNFEEWLSRFDYTTSEKEVIIKCIEDKKHS